MLRLNNNATHGGFLFIDKPLGITSFDVVKDCKRFLNIKRVGHAGTLDPLATGLMIVAFGEATKLLELLIGSSKVYTGEIILGKTSSTFDGEGIMKKSDSAPVISSSTIKKVIQQKFTGKISQMPPKFSAKKIGGVRAYTMARKGEKFELKPKEVEILKFKVVKYKWPNLSFEVECSSGTYIRSLANDLGAELGVGGYLSELRRVSIGDFLVEDACDKKIVSTEEVFKKFPSVILGDAEFDKLFNGGFVDVKSSGVKMNKKVVQKGETESVGDVVGYDWFLALYNGEIVGVLEYCLDGKFLKFRKRFNG